MKVKKVITLSRLVAKIDNDFNISDSDWIPRVAAWTIDALSQMKVLPMEKKRRTLEVSERIAQFPCKITANELRVFDDKGIAHYYSHENWSAHLALCCDIPIEVATLCNYHMLPYNEQGIATWRARLGDELWNKIMLLHECDRRAH